MLTQNWNFLRQIFHSKLYYLLNLVLLTLSVDNDNEKNLIPIFRRLGKLVLIRKSAVLTSKRSFLRYCSCLMFFYLALLILESIYRDQKYKEFQNVNNSIPIVGISIIMCNSMIEMCLYLLYIVGSINTTRLNKNSYYSFLNN